MRSLFLSIITVIFFVLTGCGSSNNDPPPPLYVTHILSDPAVDGDIAKTSGSGAYFITQGTAQTYFAGFDPADGAELRTFLQFPLTGYGGVPGLAYIESATLDLMITSISPNPLPGFIPIRIDLVDLQPPQLFADDFDRAVQPALATTTIYPSISQADYGYHVPVDVTGLMREAQRLGLPSFQLRILRDPGSATPGMIEINDSTGVNRNSLAPLLEVYYY